MGYNILIADDIPLNRKIIKAALKNIGEVVFFEAENGLEALQTVFTRDLDLIFLDLMMPEKNGFDVLADLKSNQKYASIPVIIYSALDYIGNIQEALALGAYDYFTKPLTPDQAKYILPHKAKNAIQSYEQKKNLAKLNARLEEEIRTIEYLSFHDQVTGLHNRRFFEEQLNRFETGVELPITLIIGDINGLKLTNDIFGHSEGDKLLMKIADILRLSCRECDVIARWGGDEFALILTGADDNLATDMCNRVKAACSLASVDSIRPSISLGWSVKKSPYQDMQTVLKEAEDRMYRHKLLESKSIRSSILFSLNKTLFEKSSETEEHAQRLSVLSSQIGQEMGLSGNEMDELHVFSILHDIGKIAISDDILAKPGTLTSDEREIMKKHCEIGYRIAQSSQELAYISEYILSHHERWDGNGYPLGLKAKEIPKLSRILAVADAYDVMTHERPYRKPVRHQDAMEEIFQCTGTQFDPAVTAAFTRIMGDDR